jgi:hypothetical protein
MSTGAMQLVFNEVRRSREIQRLRGIMALGAEGFILSYDCMCKAYPGESAWRVRWYAWRHLRGATPTEWRRRDYKKGAKVARRVMKRFTS